MYRNVVVRLFVSFLRACMKPWYIKTHYPTKEGRSVDIENKGVRNTLWTSKLFCKAFLTSHKRKADFHSPWTSNPSRCASRRVFSNTIRKLQPHQKTSTNQKDNAKPLLTIQFKRLTFNKPKKTMQLVFQRCFQRLTLLPAITGSGRCATNCQRILKDNRNNNNSTLNQETPKTTLPTEKTLSIAVASQFQPRLHQNRPSGRRLEVSRDEGSLPREHGILPRLPLRLIYGGIQRQIQIFKMKVISGDKRRTN